MIDISKYHDGTGREPRQKQKDVFEWIETNKSTRNKVLVLSTGMGKTFVAIANMQTPFSVMITPNNVLIDQIERDYPNINTLKGIEHYDSKEEYLAHRKRMTDGQPTVCNPISYYYYLLNQHKRGTPYTPKTLIIDEAHNFVEMLKLLCGKRIKETKYKLPTAPLDEIKVVDFLAKLISDLVSKEVAEKDFELGLKIQREIDQLVNIKTLLIQFPNLYSIDLLQEFIRKKRTNVLEIAPLQVPKHIIKEVINAEQVILMSATLYDHDIKEILDRQKYVIFRDKDLHHKNKKVFPRFISGGVNYKTPPLKLAEKINEDIWKYNVPTLIHVPYGWSTKLKPYLSNSVMVNNSADKNEVYEKYCKRALNGESPVWLAGGCAEGIDLKDDLCRLIIIPIMLKPNLGSHVVKKRMGWADGQEWYEKKVLKTFFQQIGRGVRSQEDRCDIIVYDRYLAGLARRYPDIMKDVNIQWHM